MQHTSFAAATRGLNRNLPPMRLDEKAKCLGTWNPSAIDFAKDKTDWVIFTEHEKNLIWMLLALFAAGEEAVTLDLLPPIEVIARAGQIEQEMRLATFLFEEICKTAREAEEE